MPKQKSASHVHIYCDILYFSIYHHMVVDGQNWLWLNYWATAVHCNCNVVFLRKSIFIQRPKLTKPQQDAKKINRVHIFRTLQWHHHGRDSVSNHQPHDCLLNLLFRRRSKKTSKLRVTDWPLIHRGPVNFLHKWPVTRKIFSFDDVIMKI